MTAIYWFARTADDLADEGEAAPAQRLADLAAYRADLDAALQRGASSQRWPQVFAALSRSHRQHAFPGQLLRDLLSAFEQDVRNPPYPDRATLQDYCRRSANPIGRLLLHLYGVMGASDLQRSDAICTALQLINFWQDLGVDQQRGRNYLPAQDLARHGVLVANDQPMTDSAALRAAVRSLCDWAESLRHQGAPLASRLPGRAGWELRLVVQGGLRILEKITLIDHATLSIRPTVGRMDLPVLLWRAFRMTAQTAA